MFTIFTPFFTLGPGDGSLTQSAPTTGGMPLVQHMLSACRRRPLLTGVGAAGMKGALADLTGQLLLQDGEYRPTRTLAFAMWNATYCGLGVYGLYSVLLPRYWPIVTMSGGKNIPLSHRPRRCSYFLLRPLIVLSAPHALASRHICYSVAFDNFIATPVLCLPTYYLCHTFIEASAADRQRPTQLASAAIRTYAAEAGETLRLSWCLWVPIHCATFSVIPVPLRTHWVAACSFVTLSFMSLLQNSLEKRRAPRSAAGEQ